MFACSDHINTKLAVDTPLDDAINFSKQELMDCIEKRTSGLVYRHAYPYVVAHGLHRDEDYPYIAVQEPCLCHNLLQFWNFGISDFQHLQGKQAILDALDHHPVVASVKVYESLIRH